jgi:twitching motility protein PilT
MSEVRPQPLMGRIAVQLKMIDMNQLAEATREQGRHPEALIGDIFVDLGFITTAQLAQLVRAQKGVIARHRARVRGAAQAMPPGEAPQPAASSPPSTSSREELAEAPAAPTAALDSPAAPEPGIVPPSTSTERAESPAAPKESTAATIGTAPRDVAPRDTTALDALLREAVARGASDLHLHSGAPARVRVCGALEDLPGGPADPPENERVVVASLSSAERQRFEASGEIDFCYEIGAEARFRANLYRQQRGVDAVFRLIRPEPPTLDELGLPATLARYTNFHQGMVLIAGPTGCGKTSTLAALVNLINEERREHIITIEDPIEYVHPAKRCLVNQRSVGPHTESFSRALRASLREDPDVIVIGELRDLETISLALTAAETGHFVLATLHTDNAIRTINRVVGAYPSDQQDQIRTMLSESLRAVICQRLVSRSDGNGRVPALETLAITRAVGNLIRENKTFQIHSILQTGASQGMGLMDHSLRDLVRSGVVAADEARRHCDDPRVLGP